MAHTTDGTAAPATWHPEVLDGPLSVRGLLRVDEALRLADASTGLVFSVYIGDLDEPTRESAETLHGALAEPDRSVLIALSPNQRVLEIVTGSVARRRILDRDCQARRAVDGGRLRRGRPRRRHRGRPGPARRARRPPLTPYPARLQPRKMLA